MNMGYVSSTATGILLLILWSIGLSPSLVLAADDFQQQREELIEQIRDDVHTSSAVLGKSRLDDNVLKVMATVPRHEFVPDKHRHQSYRNRPLPIGYGQTISQPAIVAMMTDLLQLEPTDKALEIGTGSGYQAAILAELVEQVFSIEIVPELAERAAVDLERTGYLNVTTREGDGYYGWEEEAPFDAIIVTAASDHIPPP